MNPALFGIIIVGLCILEMGVAEFLFYWQNVYGAAAPSKRPWLVTKPRASCTLNRLYVKQT